MAPRLIFLSCGSWSSAGGCRVHHGRKEVADGWCWQIGCGPGHEGQEVAVGEANAFFPRYCSPSSWEVPLGCCIQYRPGI
ncbi:hypothetical protein BaRGS_00004015 [Batillaria attramentaria]|uniref:Secreted protein n=1 Tax=Batillaria attramentaria TaxID=370345 RepID=A0ABD0M187_9CAEN